MVPQILPVRLLLNSWATGSRPYGPDQRAILNAEANEAAYQEISSWSAYAVTPLLQLRGLAKRLDLGSVWYKDEGQRLGLGSFKALGGAYGVSRILARAHESGGPGRWRISDSWSGEHRGATRGITISCATLGNHGLSVAWAAKLFGCRAVVYMPRHTAPPRVAAIQELGAEVVPVDGGYEDALALAQADSQANGWWVVSDTAYPGYEEIPRFVMQGYTVMVREALTQLPGGRPPTHVFVQGGVGGLAGAVAGFLWERFGPTRPKLVVVEPSEADCLMETALRDEPHPSLGSLDSSMSCLTCRVPSTLAWPILRGGADAFLTLPDAGAEETVAYLSQGMDGNPPVGTQPSGAAGVAGLITAAYEPALSEPLNLGENSVVLVFGSEGPPHRPPENG